jgi:hypothetical protein
MVKYRAIYTKKKYLHTFVYEFEFEVKRKFLFNTSLKKYAKKKILEETEYIDNEVDIVDVIMLP